MNFYEKYLAREVELDEIDDYVETWHKSESELSLQEYLGLTEDMFEEWIIRGNRALVAKGE